MSLVLLMLFHLFVWIQLFKLGGALWAGWKRRHTVSARWRS